MKTAEDIAAGRPPDRVTYTDWELDPEDQNPPERREMVAVEWSLFTVRRYEEVVHVHQRERRKRMEFWTEPTGREFVKAGDEWAVQATPRAEVGRWEWEYRRTWRLKR